MKWIVEVRRPLEDEGVKQFVHKSIQNEFDTEREAQAFYESITEVKSDNNEAEVHMYQRYQHKTDVPDGE